MLQNYKVTLVIVMVLVFGGFLMAFQQQPQLGLDLKGGTRLTLQAVPSADVPEINKEVMSSLHFVLEKRVNSLGVSEAIVQQAGQDRMIVEIPGISDPEEAKKRLGKVGKLEFKIQKDGEWQSTGIGGKDLSRAALGTDAGGGWAIDFTLNSQGTQSFGDLTAKLAPQKEPLGIFFDDEYISSPTVQSPILDGRGQITGGDLSQQKEKAKELVDTLNAGALPIDVNLIEENTVGPLLGQSSIEKSLNAGLAGLGLVILFMVAYYRIQGVVAAMALAVYALLTYAAYMLVGVTFTLAGIAGFIMSIGMAVDANILIFERTKEELLGGRSLLKAIEVGFDRAFPSILDSNVTTIITCALLYWLGTGSVKGFAVTLAIGVAVSMFSAITVTKTLLQLLTASNSQMNVPFLFGVKPQKA